MRTVECLIDYRSEPRKERLQVNSQSRGRGNRSFKPTSNSNKGERYFYHKGSHQGNYQGSHWNKEKAPESKSSTVPRKDKYFVNALSQLTSRTSGSKQHIPQTSSHCEADFKEDEDVVGAFSHQCNTISHRVIEKDDVSQKKIKKVEASKPCVCKAKGLMYIDVKINGKPIKAMVDIGTTHNYLTSSEVECLGLVLEKGLEFLWDTKTAVLPFSDSLMMMESKPCVILMLVGKMEIEELIGPIPKPVRRHLHEFEDVMLEELPWRLPPRRAIDHEIELIPSAKPPVRVSYRMAQPELEELRKQLAKILDSGIVMPVKSPYGAPALF
ncbi:Uncharacterized protein Adt_23550 [Abeliophyllum distichum]|uniref:Uncharacterized protein n=1 Tax=Abeliophyllum distichum TaxID=126358 RepID=A0ABD1SBM4_9LAMI